MSLRRHDKSFMNNTVRRSMSSSECRRRLTAASGLRHCDRNNFDEQSNSRCMLHGRRIPPYNHKGGPRILHRGVRGRQDRRAEGREWGAWGSWEGGSNPLPHQLGGLGSAELPQRGSGVAPTAQRFSTNFCTQDGLSWHYNIVLLWITKKWFFNPFNLESITMHLVILFDVF